MFCDASVAKLVFVSIDSNDDDGYDWLIVVVGDGNIVDWEISDMGASASGCASDIFRSTACGTSGRKDSSCACRRSAPL